MMAQRFDLLRHLVPDEALKRVDDAGMERAAPQRG
jgi:hypothetical protein